jgi:molecular chaperone GrpE
MSEHTPESENWDDDFKKLVEDALGDAPSSPTSAATPADGAEALLAERTADLQRVQAEYANYKKRVDRDRALARQGGIEAVIADLLPVLDGIEAARAHGELEGGAKLLADELAKVAAKYGLEPFGAEGEPFDPHVHEALMSIDKPGYSVTSVAQVFQSGYKLKDRVLRPARVGVAEASEPESHAAADSHAAAGSAEPEPHAEAAPDVKTKPKAPRPPRKPHNVTPEGTAE